MYRILGFFVLVMGIMNYETPDGKAFYMIFGSFGRDTQFFAQRATNAEHCKFFNKKSSSTLHCTTAFYLFLIKTCFCVYFTSSNVIYVDIQQYTSVCCKYDTNKKAIKIKYISLYVNYLYPT